MFPSVNVNVSNGNLLRDIQILDGVGSLMATAITEDNIGKIQKVYSYEDAIAKGLSVAAEPFISGLIEQYYTELGGNQQLYVFGVPESMTMAQMVNSTNADGLKKLLAYAEGEITMCAIARKPPVAYDGGIGFLDTDVQAAVLASKPLAQFWQSKNKPFRLLIEGRIADETAENAFHPNTASNGFAGVVLGNTSAGSSAAVGLALARACKYAAHIKLGSGQNGALTPSEIYIGSKPYKERLDIENLHDQGFITFQKRDGSAGFFFGRDNMASADDYSILVHGRVIDKAQRIVAAAYSSYIETDVDVQADGSISDIDSAHLEAVLMQAIKANMGGQISQAQVIIPSQTGIVNTSTLNVKVAIMPKGYLTWIVVDLGLTAQIS